MRSRRYGGPKIPRQARALIADALPPAVLPALSVADLERIRLHLTDTPAPETGLGQRDYLGAACVFLLVFSCTFPVVLPFLVWQDPRVALTVSNSVAMAMLFLTGYTLGRQSGRPWVVGLTMVALGLSLVAVAMALGG